MLRAIVFSTILVFAGADPALAQDDDFARNGIYLGVNMAGTWYRDVRDEVAKEIGGIPPPKPFPTESVTVEEPFGLGARVGYRFHPHFAAEVQLQWFTNAAVRFIDEDATVIAFEFENLAFSGNVKAYPLTGRIQPFLLAGVGLMHFSAKDKVGFGTKTSGEDFAARFGAGIDFYITPSIAAFAEGGYVLTTGELDGLGHVGLDHVVWSVGLQYRF
jgi:opacity protein-like surface antigen